jgi:hypothetical protein
MIGRHASWLGALLLAGALPFPGPARDQRGEFTAVSAFARDGHGSVSNTDPFANPGSAGRPPDVVSAADPDAPAACDLASAVRTATITFGEAGVLAAPCIVVSAGDLVTWVNPLATPIAIQADDDQFFTEDMSTGLSTLEVPAQGTLTVRVIHAGRIDYAAPDRPGFQGTILVLGHEAA